MELHPLLGLAMVIALAVLLYIHIYRRNKPARDEAARRRGLAYALVELHEADDELVCLERLEAEAENGLSFDPDPFDRAILDVTGTRRYHRDERSEVLLQVAERLESMVSLGEASPSEVGVAMNLVERMLTGEDEEPHFFVVEHIRLEGGQAVLQRRALSEWPTWAEELDQRHGTAQSPNPADQLLLDVAKRSGVAVDLESFKHARSRLEKPE